MAKVIVVIEVADSATDFIGKSHCLPDKPTIDDNVHEALCKAIHEKDKRALAWLTRYVVDIATDD